MFILVREEIYHDDLLEMVIHNTVTMIVHDVRSTHFFLSPKLKNNIFIKPLTAKQTAVFKNTSYVTSLTVIMTTTWMLIKLIVSVKKNKQ